MAPSKSSYISALAFKFLQEKNSYQFLANIRQDLSQDYYGPFVDEILKRPKLKEKIAIFREKPSYSDLQTFLKLAPVEALKELSWFKAFLIRAAPMLTNFINISNDFSRQILLGEYEEATNSLNAIESEYGCSIWLIKNKMALLQLHKGLQAQKAYADEIKQDIDHSGIIAYLTYWISLRNEDSVTAGKYEQQFEQNYKLWDDNTKDDLNTYIRYNLLADESWGPDKAIELPRIDFSRSLIDFYESFISFSRISIVADPEFKSTLLFTIKALMGKINDKRLVFLHNIMANDPSSNCVNDLANEAYDFYLTGNVDKAKLTAEEGLMSSKDNPYLLLIDAFIESLNITRNQSDSDPIFYYDNTALNPLKEGPAVKTAGQKRAPIDTIKKTLIELFLKGLGNQSAINSAEKLFQNLATLSWSGIFPLAFYLLDASKTERRTTITHLFKYGIKHPLLLRVSEKSSTFDNISKSLEIDNNLVSMKLVSLIRNWNEEELDKLDIFPEEKNIHKGRHEYSLGNYDKAIKYAKILMYSDHAFFQRQGIQLMANSLLKSQQISDTCNFIIKQYILNQSITSLFPLSKLIPILNPKTSEWKVVSKTISLPIILDMIIKYTKGTEESYRSYACEDYLMHNGLQRPSQLEFDGSSEMLYFMKFLCIESIMDISTEYESPEDVEKERLLILRKLLLIDAKHKDEYNTSIKKIIRRQVIRQKMLEMEQNKIYVDLEKFRNWANMEIKENFLRYLVYLRNGLDIFSQNQILEAKTKGFEEDNTGLLNMVAPLNEPFSLFKSILTEILEAYSSSSEFGLDRYLSTRLRHGAIENQLRKFMSQNHLITKKESKEGIYKRNFHWLERLGSSIYDERELDAIFKRFSERYDKLIEKIIYEWIVINRGNNDQALFMPPLRHGEILLLQGKVTTTTSFTQFLEIIISYMEDRLTGTLLLVREKLNKSAKPDVLKMLNQLQEQVSKDGVISELDNAIHTCRTQVQGVFERISDWFSPASSFENTEFPLEDAISVAEAIVQDTTPNFSVKVSFVEGTEPIKINKLPIFFDIMTNVFENVVKRSGLEIPAVHILISVRNSNNEEFLILSMTNELGPEIDMIKLQENIDEKKRMIEENSYQSEIVKEDGTGLFKIIQSLKDLNQSPKHEVSIDFGLAEKQYFLNLTFPPVKKANEQPILISANENTDS